MALLYIYDETFGENGTCPVEEIFVILFSYLKIAFLK